MSMEEFVRDAQDSLRSLQHAAALGNADGRIPAGEHVIKDPREHVRDPYLGDWGPTPAWVAWKHSPIRGAMVRVTDPGHPRAGQVGFIVEAFRGEVSVFLGDDNLARFTGSPLVDVFWPYETAMCLVLPDVPEIPGLQYVRDPRGTAVTVTDPSVPAKDGKTGTVEDVVMGSFRKSPRFIVRLEGGDTYKTRNPLNDLRPVSGAW
jgi:hypothetical protein